MITIIGLGPTGMVLAALLGQAGVEVTALEKRRSLPQIPRAIALDSEALRILQKIGIAPALLAKLRPQQGLHFFDQKRRCYLKTAIKEENGYEPSSLFYQPDLENLIEARLAELPNVKALWGHEFQAFQQQGDKGIQIQGRDSEGNAYTLFTNYLIGCDGANSKVREYMGVEMEGFWKGEGNILKADAWSPQGLLPKLHAVEKYSHPTGSWVQMQGVSQSRGVHRRWEFQLGSQALANAPSEELQQAAEQNLRRIGLSSQQIEQLDWDHIALYHYRSAVASSWTKGNAVLAGDAAHLMPPYIGQGLCAGLRDAHNLYWKLLRLQQPKPPKGLLESYQAERRPQAVSTIRISMGVGWIFKTPIHKPLSAAIRYLGLPMAKRPLLIAPPPIGKNAGHWGAGKGSARLFPQAELQVGGKTMLSDEVWGKQWAYISPAPISDWELEYCKGLGILPFEVKPEMDGRGTLRRWFRRHGRRGVLLRPDGYVFGRLEKGLDL